MKAFNLQQKARQAGQGMTEYIIIVALIAVAAIGVYSYFGQAIRGQTAQMTNEIAGGTSTTGKDTANTANTSAGTQASTKQNLGNYAGQSSK
jgi:type IV pilus assembly protein PilA